MKKQVALSQKGGIKLDFLGFGLLGLCFGSLEFVLDKGQEDDWFSSGLITFFTVAMIVAFIAMIWWELKQLREGHRPILNLTLFKRPNFSISFLLMFVLGFSLYGTTILIPQLVQTLLGYTAELAGLVLSPAGLMMMCMMPVVGFLVGRIDPRKLIAYGFVMLTISLITMHTMDLSVSYGRLVFLRCFQASGLAFLFIPINTISYIGVKQSENNDVSGLTNLARNIGGSCGTAFMATMLTRRTAAHESNMTRNLTTGNPAFMNQVAQLKGMFGGHTSGNPMTGTGSHAAQAYIYNQLHRQAGMLGYPDTSSTALFCACMPPLIFFIPVHRRTSTRARALEQRGSAGCRAFCIYTGARREGRSSTYPRCISSYRRPASSIFRRSCRSRSPAVLRRRSSSASRPRIDKRDRLTLRPQPSSAPS